MDVKYQYKERKGEYGLYGVLGIYNINASRWEIKKAFNKLKNLDDTLVLRAYNQKERVLEKEDRIRHLSMFLKSHQSDQDKIGELSGLGVEMSRIYSERERLRTQAKQRWNNIKYAYSILSDRVKRKVYDLQAFPEKCDRKQAIASLENVLERQAHIDYKQLTPVAAKVLKRQGHNGLIILEARYGDIFHTVEERPGCYIDVRIPLQAMVGEVEEGVLEVNTSMSMDVAMPMGINMAMPMGMLMPSSMSSYAFLRGFYNPLWRHQELKDERSYLEVIYKYQGKLHKKVFKDGSDFVLPRREHLLDSDEKLQDHGWRPREARIAKRNQLVGRLAVVSTGFGLIFALVWILPHSRIKVLS